MVFLYFVTIQGLYSPLNYCFWFLCFVTIQGLLAL